jgi:hypothetical protein
MSLATNNPPGTTETIADIKKLLINEFQKPSSEDQYMNEMINIRQKLGESVWEIDQRLIREDALTEKFLNFEKSIVPQNPSISLTFLSLFDVSISLPFKCLVRNRRANNVHHSEYVENK